jgi:hypothetical protein
MTASLILTGVLLSPLATAPPAKSEPTNAAEAAAKKAAADKLVDEQYAAWVSPGNVLDCKTSLNHLVHQPASRALHRTPARLKK